MSVRAIDTGGYEKPSPKPQAGDRPRLRWIDISLLVIDPAYQRPILRSGRANVQAIADQFRWAYFMPVVVSEREDGRFAIIDGQHRTTAARLIGEREVPCEIVTIGPQEQARAFAAINGVTTRIHNLALHAAEVAGGIPEAVALHEMCVAAGVDVLRYPVQISQQGKGQTMAVGAIRAAVKAYGAETVSCALRAVTQTPNNLPGMLTAPMIKALVETRVMVGGGCDDEAFIAAFADIVISKVVAAAAAPAWRAKFASATDALSEKLFETARRALERRSA